jgi:hypothetical protein
MNLNLRKPTSMVKTILLLFCTLASFSQLKAQHSIISLNDPQAPAEREIPVQGVQSSSPDSTLRLRRLHINPALQSQEAVQEGDTLLLDLFNGVHYKATIDRTETDVNGTWMLRAAIIGESFGYAFITTSGASTLVTIEIPGKNELYSSRLDPATGITYLRQINRSVQVPLEGAESIIPDSTGNKNPAGITNDGIGVTGDETSPDIVTVLILYTPAAENWARSNDSGIENTIAQVMSRAQVACDNSKLLMTVKLARSELINYTEKNSVDDLYGLAYTNDGIMENVQGLRNTYCADLVVLLEYISYTGGQGFLLNNIAGSAEYGYSLTRVQQASWTYTTIHEIGHNMGAHHHKQQTTQPGPGIFTYSAGWRWTGSDGGKYCSVMTYESASSFADGIAHTRVGYFSSPEIRYLGVATGDAVNADNARTMRKTKAVVAAYRTGCCTPPTVQASAFEVKSTTANTVTIGWTRGNGTEGVLVVGKARADVSAVPVCGLTYTANSEWGLGRLMAPSNYALYRGTGNSVTITGLVEMTEYHFAVFEYNSNGYSYLTPALTGTATTACVSGSAPMISSVTQPTCAVPTGSMLVTGLPTGSWTVYLSPGTQTFTGSGTQKSLQGIVPGTYTVRYTNSGGCYSPASDPATINAAPLKAGTPWVETVVQPNCNRETGTITVTGLPSGNWILKEVLSGLTYTASGQSYTLTGLSPGSYRFAVTHQTLCPSDTSAMVVINRPPEKPLAPVISRVIQPDCLIESGSIEITGLPGSGNWILTLLPGQKKIPGSGTTLIIEELMPGNYSFSVTNADGCNSPVSKQAVVNARPVIPDPPAAGTVTHPTCTLKTGTIELTGLPAEGTWVLTAVPAGKTLSGSGTSVTWTGFESGTWEFTVTHASGCTSKASAEIKVNPAPPLPDPPVISGILQPTCIRQSGTISLSGLPAGNWILQGTDGHSYSGNSSTFEIEEVNPGTYTFRITNESGCTSVFSAEAVVSEPPVLPVPLLTLSGNKILSNATEGNQWYNQYGKIEGATGTDFTPAYNGDYYVIVTVGSCVSAQSEMMRVTGAGIALNLYPNPFREQIIIELKGLMEECRYTLLNSMGRAMRSGKLTDLNTLETSNLAAGLYIIRLEIGNELIYRRLIKGQ